MYEHLSYTYAQRKGFIWSEYETREKTVNKSTNFPKLVSSLYKIFIKLYSLLGNDLFFDCLQEMRLEVVNSI